MAHIGHPLAGDPVYGRTPKIKRGVPVELVEAIRSFPRQALHAHKLKLTHPGSGIEVKYQAPLPEDLDQLLATLEPFVQ
jgi:23S rRNA pseudouridine1911/1915/1917 synthase